MYIIERETELALMDIAVMHPNTSIEELLMLWVERYHNQQEKDFESYLANEGRQNLMF